MAAFDEILELEQRIHDLSQDQTSTRLKLSQCEDNLGRARDLAEAARKRVALHRGNRVHMKHVADHVDILEWKKNEQHLSDARDGLEEARRTLSIATAGRIQLRARIVTIEREIAEARRQLKTYGRVEAFPARKEVA